MDDGVDGRKIHRIDGLQVADNRRRAQHGAQFEVFARATEREDPMAARHEFGDEVAAEEAGASSDKNFTSYTSLPGALPPAAFFLPGKESLSARSHEGRAAQAGSEAARGGLAP